jgi:hypothetical protein
MRGLASTSSKLNFHRTAGLTFCVRRDSRRSYKVSDAVGTDLKIHVWYDEDQDVIKMRVEGELTSVNDDPSSKRGNPSLYKLLARALRDAGKKHPVSS